MIFQKILLFFPLVWYDGGRRRDGHGIFPGDHCIHLCGAADLLHHQGPHRLWKSPDLRAPFVHAAGQRPHHPGDAAAGLSGERLDHLEKPPQLPVAEDRGAAGGQSPGRHSRDAAAAILHALGPQDLPGRGGGSPGRGDGHPRQDRRLQKEGPAGTHAGGILLLGHVRGAFRHQHVHRGLSGAGLLQL